MSKNLAPVLGEAARTHQFTLIGDGTHKKSGIPKAVAQADNFAAMQQAGVKHFFIEVPSDMQDQVDKYLSGKMPEQQLADKIAKEHPRRHKGDVSENEQNLQIIRMMKMAHDHGMQVHCADQRQEKMKELRGRNGPYEQYVHNGHPDADFDEFLADRYTKTMPDGSKTNFYTNDRALAKFMAEKSHGEKSAAFFGELHGGQSYDLDEILGEKRAARVQVRDTKPGVLSRLTRSFEEWGEGITPDKDNPFARYYVDSDEVERFSPKPTADMAPGEVDFSRLSSAQQTLTSPAPASAAKAAPAAPVRKNTHKLHP